MTKKEIYREGFRRGYNIASWQDLPEIGTEIKPFQVSNFIGTIETMSDAEEVFFCLAGEAESNDREYSPFEFTAKELNDLEETKPYDVWEVYENGISAGMIKNWKERKGYYKE